MRFLGLTLLVLVFFGLPVLLLQGMVMPEIEKLQYTYSNLDKIAERAVASEL